MNTAAQLTYSGIGLAVFAQQLCLPLPAVFLLMTTGALAAQGEEPLHLPLVLLSGVVGCLVADGVWFWLGRRWGSAVIRLVCGFTSNPQRSRERSHQIFDRWGLRLLVVAKFVPGLDGVAPPLAGAEGATILGFLAYDTIGSLLWTSTYVGLGYLFAHSLDGAMRVIERFGAIFMAVLCLPLLVYMAWRAARMLRMIRHLRLRRISPEMLQRKLDEGDKVVIVDLQRYEAHEETVRAIPGAFRADPDKLRTVGRLAIPVGVDVVLYCSSQNEWVSARVADAIEKKGIRDVWVLEGGLKAWALEKRALAARLSTPEEVAGRAGIVFPPELRGLQPLDPSETDKNEAITQNP